MKLIDKVAVVTGGNSGIGLAVAKELAGQGARVAIFGRDETSLAAAQADTGGSTVAIRGDVTNMSDLDRLFSTTADALGKIDVLIVNAGVARPAPIDQVDEEAFDFQSDINFKGAFFTVQRSLPYLNDGASIVLNSSVANAIGLAGMSVYSATKAALRSLARTLSAELLPRGIRVNTLSPGAIETPLWGRIGLDEKEIDEMATAIGSQIPMGRFGSSAEMAKAALFLASEDSSYVAGAELVADGGMTQV
ncbi:MAG: SDR family oxidoreductase [Gemmatimonadota bacterium]